MTNYNESVKILYDYSCKNCGWPIIFYCCNGDMGLEEYQGWDWWYSCANKSCRHHPGDGVFQDRLYWVNYSSDKTDETKQPQNKEQQLIDALETVKRLQQEMLPFDETIKDLPETNTGEYYDEELCSRAEESFLKLVSWTEEYPSGANPFPDQHTRAPFIVSYMKYSPVGPFTTLTAGNDTWHLRPEATVGIGHMLRIDPRGKMDPEDMCDLLIKYADEFCGPDVESKE